MAYSKTNWTSTTPINTTNLNKIEEGISANDTANSTNTSNIGKLSDLNTTEKSNLVGAINEVNTIVGNIIESGTNENGNYIKFADGTMICTREIEINNVTLSSQWGGWYIYEDTTIYNFAQTFKGKPHIQLSFFATSSAGACLGNYGSSVLTESSYKGFMLFRPTTQTVTGKVFIQAIGRWK